MSEWNPNNKIHGPCWVYVRNLKYALDGSLLPELPLSSMVKEYWKICWKREIFIPEGNWIDIIASEQDHIWYQKNEDRVVSPAKDNSLELKAITIDLPTAIKAWRKAKGLINKSARIGSDNDWRAAIDSYCDAWDNVIFALTSTTKGD